MHRLPKRIKEDPLLKDAVDIYNSLPDTLSRSEILKYNQTTKKVHRSDYFYRSMRFLIPNGVFPPGYASKVLFDFLFDESNLNNSNCLAMGVGLGLEAVIFSLKEANVVYAVDIDFNSIKTTEYNYYRIVGEKSNVKFCPVVSDLFGFATKDTQIKFDLITFNPPAVSTKLSSRKDVIRNTCIGADILNRFFSQIKEKRLLAPNGRIIIVLSNTSELRKIIYRAILLGFPPKILWSNSIGNLRIYLFEFVFYEDQDT